MANTAGNCAGLASVAVPLLETAAAAAAAAAVPRINMFTCRRILIFIILIVIGMQIIGAHITLKAREKPLLSVPNVSTASIPEPTASAESWDIPRILHQTYSSEMVRNEYQAYVNSCLSRNPEWEYYLWRDADTQAFIRDHYPWMMDKYRSFKMRVERSDVIRYMVLHHYGGIYLDMDIECMKPFFPSLVPFSPAFLDQERKEQGRIVYGHIGSAMNSAMGSVPGHPFYLQVLLAINSTPSSAESPLWTTGPIILTNQMNEWNRGPNRSKYPVNLLEPEVFSPIMDGPREYYLSKFCNGQKKNESQMTEKERWVKIGCDMTQSKDWKQDATSINTTVGIHRFRHLGWHPESQNLGKFNISSLRPSVKLYEFNRMKPRWQLLPTQPTNFGCQSHAC